jgi:hypothetical protein
MRLDSSGNLLVGTTSNFAVNCISTFRGIDGAAFTATGDVTNGAVYAWNTATSGNNNLIQFYTEAAATSRGNIDYNRGAGLIRYNTTSDGTLKNKFGTAPVEVSRNIILSAPISEYAWKDDPDQRKQIGPIAQELYEVFPGAVSVGGMVEREITDEEGNTTTVEEYRPWGVDKTAPVWHLVVCAQDLYAQVETLKAKVAALEASA